MSRSISRVEMQLENDAALAQQQMQREFEKKEKLEANLGVSASAAAPAPEPRTASDRAASLQFSAINGSAATAMEDIPPPRAAATGTAAAGAAAAACLPEDMPYRGWLARQIHKLIVGVSKEGNDSAILAITLTKLKRLLRRDETEVVNALLEVSIHGHTHLHDVLHLPFEHIQDKAQAGNVAYALFDELIHYVKNLCFDRRMASPEYMVALLTAITDDGFTVLQDALQYGNEKIIQGVIIYNNDGTLYRICADGTPLRTEGVITLCKEWLKPEQQTALLTNVTKDRFTALQGALKSGNRETIVEIIAWIKERVSPEQQAALLTNVTNDGFTALQHALASGNRETIVEIIAWIKEILKTKPEQQTALLMNVTEDGFTALQSALKSGHRETIQEMIEWIKTALSEKDKKRLLTQSNNKGFNILHSAAMTNDATIFTAVVELFKHSFGNDWEKEIRNLANQKTNLKVPVKPNSQNTEIEKFLKEYRNEPGYRDQPAAARGVYFSRGARGGNARGARDIRAEGSSSGSSRAYPTHHASRADAQCATGAAAADAGSSAHYGDARRGGGYYSRDARVTI